jgi:exodeoxyribonuclease-3
MKIIAWNVNGLRSLLKTDNLNQLISTEDPDIFCMGETKLSCPYDNINNEITDKFPQFKYKYWSQCKIKKGYSGTSIFCKKKPINITYGLKHNNEELDEEGRVITIELNKYYLIHVYTPNSGQALARLDFRTTIWDRAFENHIKILQKDKPVIICGDLNVAHNPIDLKNPKTNTKTAGYTIEERNSFNSLLNNCNLVDSYRIKNPDKIEYSYWSYMRNSRSKNIGWRIDYFLVDDKIFKKVKESTIFTDILGSDHAPIRLIIT